MAEEPQHQAKKTAISSTRREHLPQESSHWSQPFSAVTLGELVETLAIVWTGPKVRDLEYKTAASPYDTPPHVKEAR